MSDLIPEQILEYLRAPWVQALGLLLAALVGGLILDRILCGAIRRLARRSDTDLDDMLIDLLHRPLFSSAVLFGLYMAVQVLALQPPFSWLLIGFIKTLALLIWTTALLRMISVLVQGLGNLAGRVDWLDARMMPLFDNLSKLLVIAGSVYTFLVIWNLDVKPWLASAGIVGLAIGLAARDSLANLFGGLSLIADAPYKVGDYINLDQGDRGMVTNIGLRSTRILTRDDVEVTLPNSVIANAKIINESGGRWLKSRVRVKVAVAYGSDVAQVRRVLEQVATEEPLVLPDPAPRVRFRAMADSSLNFELLCWISNPEERGRALDALNTRVYNALNAEGISIPFPQRDVHLRYVPPGLTAEGVTPE